MVWAAHVFSGIATAFQPQKRILDVFSDPTVHCRVGFQKPCFAQAHCRVQRLAETTEQLSRWTASRFTCSSLSLHPSAFRSRPLPILLLSRQPSLDASSDCHSDTDVSVPPLELPVAVTGESEIEDYHSLAFRDLQRGQGTGLPSGESVARHMGIAPIPSKCHASTGWRGEIPHHSTFVLWTF